MGINRWIGNAIPTVQVWSLTITANDTATNYAVAINTKGVSVAGDSGGVSATAAKLAAALAASSIAELQEVTWTANAASVIGMGKTAGKPFTALAAAAGGTGAMGSVGNTTACTGPNFLDNVANWGNFVLPINGDDVYVENGTVDMLYNLDALGSVALNSFNVAASYTGNIGLLQYTGKYLEYRETMLTLQAARTNIGYGPGAGSPRVRIGSVSSAATAITVSNTGSSNEPGLPTFCWCGLVAPGSSMQVLRGSVGIGAIPGQYGGLDSLEVGYVTNVQGDAQVLIGPLSGATSYTIAGGTTVQQGNGLGSLEMSAGTLTVYGTGNCGQFAINGGTLFWNSTGQLGGGSNSISGKGILDLSQDMQAKTFVAGGVIYAAKGATINDPSNVLTGLGEYLTIEPQGCSMSDLNLNFGYGRRVQV
ncbi:MAG TPA: hypothetical protein VIK18_06145 [Pirellulales bacterium]